MTVVEFVYYLIGLIIISAIIIGQAKHSKHPFRYIMMGASIVLLAIIAACAIS